MTEPRPEYTTGEAPSVVYSSTLGLLPCAIVGSNTTHHLVRVRGMVKPLVVARANVFELAQGWALDPSGRLIGPEGAAALATCPAGAAEEV